MTNPSKAKGTAWESRLAEYFRQSGFPLCERRALSGNMDKGDLSGIPSTCIEAKNAKRIELASWMDELVAEKKNAKAEVGAVIFPRRNYPTSRAYVVMELQQFVQLLDKGQNI